MTYQDAYYASVAADEAYSRELERVYGSYACEARYKYKHADERVQAAADAKKAADAVRHAAWMQRAS